MGAPSFLWTNAQHAPVRPRTQTSANRSQSPGLSDAYSESRIIGGCRRKKAQRRKSHLTGAADS